MRQRKVKNEEERLAEYRQYTIDHPEEKKGKWKDVFQNKNGIYVEFGCGKGKFILTLAEQNPDRNYIAFEGSGSIILRALEKAAKMGLRNIYFTKEYVRDASVYFEEDELSGIYLNFSDPWPKDRHAKRRLTHGSYLEGYRKILKKDHYIEFKTDNDDLFLFAENEFQQNGLELLESTRDLHSTSLDARLVTTEYEDKFRSVGMKINYCKVRV